MCRVPACFLEDSGRCLVGCPTTPASYSADPVHHPSPLDSHTHPAPLVITSPLLSLLSFHSSSSTLYHRLINSSRAGLWDYSYSLGIVHSLLSVGYILSDAYVIS
jgi:hypothetical protein